MPIHPPLKHPKNGQYHNCLPLSLYIRWNDMNHIPLNYAIKKMT
jgi:hypothetical protein